MLNRQLPEITARPVSSIAPFEDRSPRDEPIDLTRVETFPGAACLRRVSGHPRVEANIAGWPIMFQSGSPPGRPIPSRSFAAETPIS
jgi:hypothetical protein